MSQIVQFIKSSILEINPVQNIKILHTNIKNDIVAGIMVAIIALPLGLTFGILSGLGPEAGIWSAIVGGVFGGLFGGSRIGISGPTAPMATQIAILGVAFSNTPNVEETLFSIIFLSGLILVGFSILRISKFIHYIPYSVIAGFMCGIGVTIILSQIKPFMGLSKEDSLAMEVFQTMNPALYISIPSLLILILWSSIQNKIKFLANIPTALASSVVALAIGFSIAHFMNLEVDKIIDVWISKPQELEAAKKFTLYYPNLSSINELILPAISLAALALLDSLLSCKIADNITGIRHSSNREAFGQGIANMAAGLFGGISTATATTQTVGNIAFGAKTPLSTIIKGLALFAVLYALKDYVLGIPIACLAAIVLKLGFDILDYRILPVIQRVPIKDFIVFTITLFLTVYTDLVIAVIIGVIFALLLFFKQSITIFNFKYQHKVSPISETDFEVDNQDHQSHVSVLQPQGPLFFGSVESLLNIYAKAPEHEMLIIDMSSVDMIDLSGVYALEDLIKNVKLRNIKVRLSNINPDVENVLNNMNCTLN